MTKTIVNFKKDARIVMEGMQNPGFIYIIKSGEVMIESKIQFINKKLNHYGPGDVFGFVSAILQKQHQDTLIAVRDSEIIKLSVDGFIEFMKGNPETFKKFLSKNSEKLRTFLENIDNFREPSNKDNTLEGLLEIGKKYKQIEDYNIASYALKKYLTIESPNPKEQKYVDTANRLLNEMNPNYKFPVLEDSVDGINYTYPKGTIIFVENEPEDYFYIIAKGSVKISKFINDSDLVLEVIGEGEIFGEMALLNGKSRTATAIANEDCTLLRLVKDDLIVKAEPVILTKLFILLAKRFWLASQRYYIKQLDDPNVKLYMQLQIVLEETMQRKQIKSSNTAIELDNTLEGLMKMVGLSHVDKSTIKEFLTDPILKFQRESITIYDIEDFEFKIGVLTKKYHRQMRDVYL